LSDDIGRVAAGDGPASLPGAAVGNTRRQRRPTGEPPPLPHPVAISTTAWLVLAAIVIAAAFAATLHTPWLRVDDRASTWVLRLLAGMRTPWLTDVTDGINVAGSGWGASVVGLSVVALAMAFRRWRHLLVLAVRTDPDRVYRHALVYSPRPNSPKPPRPRPAAAAHHPATLERPPGRPGRHSVRRRGRRRVCHSHSLHPGSPEPRRQPSQLRHQPFDGAHRPGSPDGGHAALHHGAPVGLACRRR
jgi:hypothetical protein